MPPIKGWLNPAYTLASKNAACQRLLNLYPEIIESGNEKAVGLLKGCPGLAAALLTLPKSPLRALYAAGTPLNPLAGTGGRLFAVAGDSLYEVFADRTYTDRSALPGATTIGNDGLRATLIPNGNQLGIVSNGLFYCDNGAGPVVTGNLAITGTVHATHDSTLVTWVSSSKFGKINSGDPIDLGGVRMVVANIVLDLDGNPDYTQLELTLPWGGATGNLIYTVYTFNGVILADGTTKLLYVSGDAFPLGGVTYINLDGNVVGVASIQDTHTIILSAPYVAGTYFYGLDAAQTAGTGAFLDTFFIVAPPNSKQLTASAPLDGTSWDGLDIAAKESYPDNVGKLLADHESLFVFGEATSEVWRSPGADANFPFQRDPSGCMSVGIGAPESACNGPQGPCWIGGNTQGKPIAYYAQGFIPMRISTHAIEQVWESYSTSADAEAFIYTMDGHTLWQIGFPTADATWVYDFTASQQMGKAVWHERNSYDGSAFHRHRARCHAYVWGKHWVGDFSNGKIYEMSSSVYQDAGQPITCIRTLPHLCAERLRQFFAKLELDLETGGGVALTITLEWSDDGGTTFVGGTGQFQITTSTTAKLDRVTFWQMGSGTDRVFRITVTGNARKALIDAFLDVTVGIS